MGYTCNVLSLLLILPSSAGAPTAEAGLPLLANVGDTVLLNGSASSDPEDDPLGFTWTQFSGPEVTLLQEDTDSPQFTVEKPGTYRFDLVVNDGIEDSEPDRVEVVVPYKSIETGDRGCSSVPGGASWVWGLALAGLLGRRR